MKTYTLLDIEKLKQVYTELAIVESDLLVFCEQVAKLLGWSGVDVVHCVGNQIEFVACWNGPYQSRDTEVFTFPAEFLVKGTSHVFEWLKEKIAEANRKLEEARMLEIEKAELVKLSYLRQKYGVN